MGQLTGQTIVSTYEQLLKITSEDIDTNASAKYIEDGKGQASALSISQHRVGIGTDSPDTTLHIRGDFDGVSTAAGMNPNKGLTISKSVDSPAHGVGDTYGISFTTDNATDSDYVIAGIYASSIGVNSHVSGKLEFCTSTDTSASVATHMTILDSGNVGIGTASPNQKLTIEGTMSMKEQADDGADVAGYSQIWVKNTGDGILMFTDDNGTQYTVDVTAV